MKKFLIAIGILILIILILVIIAPSKKSLHNTARDIYFQQENYFNTLNQSFDFCFQYYSSTEFIIHYDKEKDTLEAFIIKEPVTNAKSLTKVIKKESFKNVLNIEYDELHQASKMIGIRNINIKNGMAECFLAALDNVFYTTKVCYGEILPSSCNYNIGYSRWCGMIAENYFILSKPVIF